MLQENKNKILVISIVILIIIGGVIYYLFQSKDNEEYLDFEENVQNVIKESIENEVIEEKAKIVVHISGQVVNPGVITLDEGSRLVDAINAANGTTKEADLNKINLAYILEDAQKIYIPSIKDKENDIIISSITNNGVTTSKNEQTASSKEEKVMVNINTASKEELQKLSGIGESTAEKIIAYRKENGKFNAIEDIQKVNGIGSSKYNKIKNNICVK